MSYCVKETSICTKTCYQYNHGELLLTKNGSYLLLCLDVTPLLPSCHKIWNQWYIDFSGFVVVQLLSHVQLFATPWTGALQTPLCFTISQSLLKFKSIELVRPSNHLILCRPLLLLPSIFPSMRVFPMSQVFASGGQSSGASASATVLPMNIQNWFPLGLSGWISFLSKGPSRVFSNTTAQKHQFVGA